jgi:branched-chain amino acid transport system ATP-binding protein
MTEPLLSLRHLHKRFGGLAVTDDVSLDIASAEIHAVIGPNGAGKTTLINEISGVLPVDSGQILFGGRDITALSMPRRARLGLARSFQITSVVNAFSALENTALAVQARSGSSFRFIHPAAGEATLNDAAMAALDQVGLAARAHTQAGAMSHGEKRQLELAIALATEPRLLLLDEPLAGAGPEETERLIGILRGLKSRYTIVLVEHDMQAVFALADRISVLVYGRLIATDTPDIIRAHPEVRAAYLGEDDLLAPEAPAC